MEKVSRIRMTPSEQLQKFSKKTFDINILDIIYKKDYDN